MFHQVKVQHSTIVQGLTKVPKIVTKFHHFIVATCFGEMWNQFFNSVFQRFLVKGLAFNLRLVFITYLQFERNRVSKTKDKNLKQCIKYFKKNILYTLVVSIFYVRHFNRISVTCLKFCWFAKTKEIRKYFRVNQEFKNRLFNLFLLTYTKIVPKYINFS